jgi:myo-inositol-1(or 4)-monophosphatase
LSTYLSLAQSAAEAAATLLRRDYLADAQVTDDVGKDLKTRADMAAQELIIQHLQSSGIPVLAEEGAKATAAEINTDQPLWLVDPLDGTLNFTRGFAMAGVSISLWDKGQPVIGVIQDINHGHIYAGEVGQGAWLNGQPMRVSSVASVSSAILATGFPSGRSYDTESLLGFVKSVQTYKKVRMLGSAALMLAQVAAGHFDVYEEEDIYLWDVAAGLALVSASGGGFNMLPGSDTFKFRVRASNGIL